MRSTLTIPDGVRLAYLDGASKRMAASSTLAFACARNASTATRILTPLVAGAPT